MNNVRVLLVDKQELALAGIKHILGESGRFEVVGEVGEEADLGTAITQLSPQILVLDYDYIPDLLPETILKLSKQHAAIRWIIITDNNEPDKMMHMLEANVAAFLTKACSQQEVIHAFNAVANGQKFFCNRVLDLLVENKTKKKKLTEADALTQREIQIIRYIAEGLSTQEIADNLHLSPHTINAHRKNILKKMDANTPIELVLKALRMKVIDL